jgi:hypothetical protein
MTKLLCAIAMSLILMGGCGGDDDPIPFATKTVVTLRHYGAPLAGAIVQETVSPESEDVLAGGVTDSSGQFTFDVPSSTSTGKVCFVYCWYVGGDMMNKHTGGRCTSLSSVPASVVLDVE